MNIVLPEINIDKITDSKLAAKVIQLVNILEDALKQIGFLIKENATLKQEIARLKKQSSPPKFEQKNYSATKKMEIKSVKWKKSRKKGTLHIDQVVALPNTTICSCGETKFTTIRTHARVIQDIIIKRNNILYQWTDCRCANCGKIYNTILPKEIKGQEFGASLRSWTSVFKYDYRFTLPLLHRFYTGIGIRISTGELSHIILTNSGKLKDAYVYLKVWGIKISKYIQSDATGIKRKATKKGSTILREHLNFFGHKFLSIFKITRRYNSATIAHFLGKTGRKKPFISDDASCYGELLRIIYKQLCWLHEIRHYLKLDPLFSHHKKKQTKVISELWKFYQQAKAYCLDPTEEGRAAIVAQFDIITNQKTGYRELDHRLELTKKKRERLLIFLDHPFVPIHNNQSEQDVRDAVMIRMISRETKSKAGDRSLERHLSIIHTAKKQGLDVFETVHGLLTGQLSPSVLLAKTL